MSKILEVKKITKRFPGVTALDRVDFDLNKGEVHALVGENGAGKSTLIKILAGIYYPDEGEVWLNGERFSPRSPQESQELGISVIHQELNLVPYLNAVENIFMGRQPLKNRLGFIDWKKMKSQTQSLLDQLGISLKLNVPVGRLSVAHQQMVEIAKALSYDSQIIIMDEPTATLTDEEIKKLFNIIKKLSEKGVSIIYVSHRLGEIKELADRVTVLRDGQYIGTEPVEDITIDEIIQMMVGRNIKEKFPRIRRERGREKLRVENLSRDGELKDINFSVYEGEILGIAGLVGAGRTETVRTIMGADSRDSGDIYLDDEKLEINSPVDAVRYGIGLIPEERKTQGFVPEMSVKGNITLPILSNLCKSFGFVNHGQEKDTVDNLVEALNIKTPGIEQKVKNLSGGNQQKVVLAKWFAQKCDVLIFDEPTRGIDVGAKIEIYNLMNELIQQGKAIIMISSEMPEILGMSDRILVMHEGTIKGELDYREASQEKIMNLIVGDVTEGEMAYDGSAN